MNLEKEYLKELDFFRKPKEKTSLIQKLIKIKEELLTGFIVSTILGLVLSNCPDIYAGVSFIIYCIGLFFGIKGALLLKDHNPDNRSQENKDVFNLAMKYMLICGLLFSFQSFLNIKPTGIFSNVSQVKLNVDNVYLSGGVTTVSPEVKEVKKEKSSTIDKKSNNKSSGLGSIANNVR